MEYLRSGLKTVLKNQGGEVGNADIPGIVETLVGKMYNSTSLTDRTDALRGLNGMSKKYREEVSATGLHALISVLENDSEDGETVALALDTLLNIMATPEEEEGENKRTSESDDDIGRIVSTNFIDKTHNVGLVLSFLERKDFGVRFASLRLVAALLDNNPKEMQEKILASAGVSNLVDLLSDNREIIRNEALLALRSLANGHVQIQKIIAFQNVFERLFEIISLEGIFDGGIVVEDCFVLMMSLLKNNNSNQTMFREYSCIQKIQQFFAFPDRVWSMEACVNIQAMLQVLRILVSPNNQPHNITACQAIVKQSGILHNLLHLLLVNGVPTPVLVEVIGVLADCVRNNVENQKVVFHYSEPAHQYPALIALLMAMVDERLPLDLRCCILYCFRCLIVNNPDSQKKVLSTLLPTSRDAEQLTPGQFVCQGLFAESEASHWLSAVALSYVLCNNEDSKEEMLQVQLLSAIGHPVSSLLQISLDGAMQIGKFHSKVGYLMLLATWLTNAKAMDAFLALPDSVSFLTSQIVTMATDDHGQLIGAMCAFLFGLALLRPDMAAATTEGVVSRKQLEQIMEKRIGLDVFVQHLQQMQVQEAYSKAALKPQVSVHKTSQLLLEHTFTTLFREKEGQILKAVRQMQAGPDGAAGTSGALNGADGDDDCLTAQPYKEIIRQQDRQRSEDAQTIERLTSELRGREEVMQRLRDENLLLKDGRYTQSNGIPDIQPGNDRIPELEARLAQLEAEKQWYAQENERLNWQISNQQQMQQQSYQVNAGEGETDAFKASMAQNTESQRKIAEMTNEILRFQQQQAEYKAENVKLQKELESMRSEHDDLLVLMTDLDTKNDQYKDMLKTFDANFKFEEDDEEDDDDGLGAA